MSEPKDERPVFPYPKTHGERMQYARGVGIPKEFRDYTSKDPDPYRDGLLKQALDHPPPKEKPE
jgi:hypothetical protein